MTNLTRRGLLKGGLSATALAALPASIQNALAAPAAFKTGTIKDVKHVVMLMQENRSFDMYFGTKVGVRGFGDPHPHPTVSGDPVWFQKSDATASAVTTLPFNFKGDENWALVPSVPHTMIDQQGGWGQGIASYWPQFKTATAMGYYKRDQLPFQFALAEAFTVGDDYHCGINSGTDPNRICMVSGSAWDPVLAAKGIPCTDADGEPVNLRCWVKGTMPTPGYTYDLIKANQPFTWPTIADVLTQKGISWRIYQDMNDNWTGAMSGFLAFDSFRTAQPGSTIYENGMKTWTVADLKAAVEQDKLPTVSWVLPSRTNSEHPGGPSSPGHGGHFVETVLDALTANPQVWSKTVFILNFDENDGYFDHAVNPAVPSYDVNGEPQGKTTMPTKGLYFDNSKRTYQANSYLDSRDTISGDLRPWGMGPRVPFYVVSPWSKGGWVNSEVADHTSPGLFLEKWLGIHVPAISDWHRSVASDLTSFFNFRNPNDAFPDLPDMSNYAADDAASSARPKVTPPANQSLPVQEPGFIRSRALPYELHVKDRPHSDGTVALDFINRGDRGAVFHVYDVNNLNRIPRRYTVEAHRHLQDDYWDANAVNFAGAPRGSYNLLVYGPNGFFRQFKGRIGHSQFGAVQPSIELDYDKEQTGIRLAVQNTTGGAAEFTVTDNAYGAKPQTISVASNETAQLFWSVKASGNWYDFSVAGPGEFLRTFAGRMEDGRDLVSDPMMGRPLVPYDERVLEAEPATA
jgi:phospholipase C